MVVVVVSSCPPSLRGDLTLWLQEVSTGVYVGHVSARVREHLWMRITENIKSGQATLVFSSDNEQGHKICVHGTSWKVVDHEGLEIILKPSSSYVDLEEKANEQNKRISNAYRRRMAQKASRSRRRMIEYPNEYVVIDIETTGVDPETDTIIEIACLKINNDVIEKCFSALVRSDKRVPEDVQRITGIDDAILEQEGKPVLEVLTRVLEFLQGQTVVAHNIDFDFAFLKHSCNENNLLFPEVAKIDTLELSRRMVQGVKNYKLNTLAEHFDLTVNKTHRALEDCKVTFQLFQALLKKLNS